MSTWKFRIDLCISIIISLFTYYFMCPECFYLQFPQQSHKHVHTILSFFCPCSCLLLLGPGQTTQCCILVKPGTFLHVLLGVDLILCYRCLEPTLKQYLQQKERLCSQLVRYLLRDRHVFLHFKA